MILTRDRGTSSVAPKGEGGSVRNLAYLALSETANFQIESRICEMRYVVYSADIRRAKLADAVGRYSGAGLRMHFRHAAFFFAPTRWA